MITSLNQLDLNKRYTYADYLTWRFDHFVELLRGRIFPMSAPKRKHQDISRVFSGEIYAQLKAKGSARKLYAAPFDVRLVTNPEGKTDKEIYTVVQPDICVICDLEKLDERGCLGAPDFIIEITSGGQNGQRDIREKFQLYAETGVKEYWIARPSEQSVERFLLDETTHEYIQKGYFISGEMIPSLVLPDLEIDLGIVFEE